MPQQALSAQFWPLLMPHVFEARPEYPASVLWNSGVCLLCPMSYAKQLSKNSVTTNNKKNISGSVLIHVC